jgi:hypothetical protein
VDKIAARSGHFDALSTCDLQAVRATLLEMEGYTPERDVETLSEQIAALAAERQELRKAGASDEVLEENRAQLGRSQWALSHALIERHLPGFASA